MVCLMPITFYLCWLGAIHKRSQPTVVSGRWDFAIVLAALSGFLLVGGVLLLTLVQSDSRFVFRGNFEQLRQGWEQSQGAWLFVVVGYILLIVATASLTLVNRSRWLSIYHIETHAVELAIERALHGANLGNAARYGNRWAKGPGIVEFAPFAGMNHATIRLLSETVEARDEVERHLRAELGKIVSHPGSPGAWIGTLAGAGVLLSLCLVGMTLFVLFFR